MKENRMFLNTAKSIVNLKLICGDCGEPLVLLDPSTRLYRTHNHKVMAYKPEQ